MSKDAPSPPPAPDPTATAAAQSQYNKEAAIAQANLDRIDQVTPWGSLTYTQTGTNADGTPKYEQTQTLTPAQQQLLDQQNAIGSALGGLAQQQIGRVADTTGKAFNFNSETPLVTNISGAGDVSTFKGKTPGVDRTVASQPMMYTYGDGGPIARSFDTGGPIAIGADGGPIQRGVGPADSAADVQNVTNAIFGQATSRLDPQFGQGQDDLRARMANMGIAEGSDAYNREQGNFDRSKTDAYNDALYRAIQGGVRNSPRLFGLDLSKGQFANEAQGQAFSQDYSNANLNNTAQGQIFGQNMQGAQFVNQAQAQQYGQNAGQAQFYNTAQDQGYSQDLGRAELYNNAGQMDLSQQLSALGFNNQASSQRFNQQLQNADLTNNARQEQINEATYLRNLPLNDIAALLGTSGGVSQPNFQPFAQVGVAAPDYMGATYQSNNIQQQQYQAAQAARSQAMGSIFGLAGAVGGAAMSNPLIFASDRALKTNIVRVGKLANGLATYAYNYIGDTVRRFGVMAQDVLRISPDAVHIMPNGFMAVDYGKVW
jgi:hypothetical protein